MTSSHHPDLRPSAPETRSGQEWGGQVPEMAQDAAIRQHVVTIPRMLRLSFKYDRGLLGKLSRCYYDSIKEIFLDAGPRGQASPR